MLKKWTRLTIFTLAIICVTLSSLAAKPKFNAYDRSKFNGWTVRTPDNVKTEIAVYGDPEELDGTISKSTERKTTQVTATLRGTILEVRDRYTRELLFTAELDGTNIRGSGRDATGKIWTFTGTGYPNNPYNSLKASGRTADPLKTDKVSGYRGLAIIPPMKGVNDPPRALALKLLDQIPDKINDRAYPASREEFYSLLRSRPERSIDFLMIFGHGSYDDPRLDFCDRVQGFANSSLNPVDINVDEMRFQKLRCTAASGSAT